VSSNPWEDRVVEVTGALQNPKVVRLWGTGIAVGETPVKTLMGFFTRIVKICAYTYAFLINRRLGKPQACIKDLWV